MAVPVLLRGRRRRSDFFAADSSSRRPARPILALAALVVACFVTSRVVCVTDSRNAWVFSKKKSKAKAETKSAGQQGPAWTPPSTAKASATGKYVVGCDVGSGSARCGVVDVENGDLVGVAKKDTVMYMPQADFYEQSSDEIWAAVTESSRNAIKAAGIKPEQIVGFGFDATCSLVALGKNGAPVGIDPLTPTDDSRNVMVWMDHRANNQAERINAGGHERLRTVGGVISPEMEVPKMLWLKENMPAAFDRVVKDGGKFLDLTDFLTYMATDKKNDVRSLCTTVCKWNYDANGEGTGIGWDTSFFKSVGFAEDELVADVIGNEVLPPGRPIAGGIGAEAAQDLGVPAGTPLAIGIIDAHAGAVGTLGALLPGETEPPSLQELEQRLALIAGTSTCHMVGGIKPCFVNGVWGPYWGALFENMYLTEGGQSAAGKMLDHVVGTHAAFPELQAIAKAAGVPPTIALNDRLENMAKERGVAVGMLAADVHVTPDFNGNRSPLADPSLRGAVVGLSLSARLDDLAVLYLAAVQALAYQTRHIVDAMVAAGHEPIKHVFACGGLSKNTFYTQSHADALGMSIYMPKEDEAVLLGAAILGAVAGGAHTSVGAAMAKMTGIAGVTRPTDDADLLAFHERKYRVFRRMTDDQQAYQQLML